MRGGALFGKRDGVIRKNPLVGKRDRVIRKNPLREKELRKGGGASIKGKGGRVGFRKISFFNGKEGFCPPGTGNRRGYKDH